MSAFGAASVSFRRLVQGSGLDSWFFLRTRSRHEKILAAELQRMGIHSFLPLITCERIYANQPAKVEAPLFPGYVFLRGTSDEAAAADRTGRITQVIRAADPSSLGTELKSIDIALQAGVELTVHPYPRDGVRARVISGALQGVEGIIEDVKSATSMILGIRELHVAASMPVSAGDLQIDRRHARGVEIAGSDFPAPLRSIISPPSSAL